jgi:FkbM family methyltransferase
MYKILKLVEFYAALLQGKGYGSHTVKKEVQILKKLIKNPNLIIDIGANVGNYSSEILNLYPTTEIHLFEPSKKNFEILNSKFTSNHVFINNNALSNKKGTGQLFTDKEGSGMASLGKRRLDHFDIDYKESEQVNILTFEEYWRNTLNQRKIDVVKIDVEGFELDVLIGFGLALNDVKIVQFEFGGCNLDTKTTFQDFWYFFKENGFCVNRITPFGLQSLEKYYEIDEYYLTTNYICIKK